MALSSSATLHTCSSYLLFSTMYWGGEEGWWGLVHLVVNPRVKAMWTKWLESVQAPGEGGWPGTQAAPSCKSR